MYKTSCDFLIRHVRMAQRRSDGLQCVVKYTDYSANAINEVRTSLLLCTFTMSTDQCIHTSHKLTKITLSNRLWHTRSSTTTTCKASAVISRPAPCSSSTPLTLTCPQHQNVCRIISDHILINSIHPRSRSGLSLKAMYPAGDRVHGMHSCAEVVHCIITYIQGEDLYSHYARIQRFNEDHGRQIIRRVCDICPFLYLPPQ